MARLLRSEDISTVLFTQTQFREGYDEREVDDLLDEAAAALRHHEARGHSTAAPLRSRGVAEARFTATRFGRGYDQAEVDAFLADLVHTLQHHESGGGATAPAPRSASSSATPVTGVPGPSARQMPSPGLRGNESLGARVLRVLRGDRG